MSKELTDRIAELEAQVDDLTSANKIACDDLICEQTKRVAYAGRVAELEQQNLELAAAIAERPDFCGYAALGTGQYLLNACPASDVLPPELVIEVATEKQKEGRVIGDLKDVEPGTLIAPDRISIRIAFFSVAGLDALEQQLRILREESFPDSINQSPDLLDKRDQMRDAALLHYLSRSRLFQQCRAALELHAKERLSGEWKPELEVK